MKLWSLGLGVEDLKGKASARRLSPQQFSLCGRFEAVVSLSEVGLFEIPRNRFLCIVATISGAV